MNKRAFPVILSVIITLGLFSLSPGADKVRLGTPFKESALYSMPPLAAEEKGFWKEQGLDAEWTAFKGGAPMDQALAAGAIDIRFTSGFSAVLRVSRRGDSVIIADMQGREDMFVWVRPGGRVQSAKDLKGATIGVNRFGSLAEAYGRLVVKELGLEWQKDIRFVAAGGVPELMAALKAGHIDGTLMDFFSMAPLKVRGELRELIAVRDYLPKEWTDSVLNTR